MKHTIEYCLDETLKALLKSWETEIRKPVEAEKLLADFGLPNKHEFYKSLIRRLVADKYAEFTDKPMPEDHLIKYYQEEVLITVDGVFHLDNDGYTGQKRKLTRSKNNKLAKEILHYLYYIAATIGIIVALNGGCSKKNVCCKQKSVSTMPAKKQDSCINSSTSH